MAIDLIIDPRNHDSKQILYEALKSQERPYLVKIETAKKRTLDYNKYYWGVVIDYIADSTGTAPLVVHEQLANRFLAISKGVRLSTASLNNREFKIYTTQCRNWALEVLKIFIPLPDNVIY